MTFDSNFFPPIISAISGLAGVWLGGRLTTQREEAREKARLKAEAIYTAILVVAHLDRLINSCLDVAFDDGTREGQPAGEDRQTHKITVPAPNFEPMALNVQWKSLPPDLMYAVLNLPYRLEILDNDVGRTAEYDPPPDFQETFWTRRAGYAALGLEVLDIARRLRRHADLPPVQESMGEWDREKQMQAQIATVNAARAAYLERVQINLN